MKAPVMCSGLLLLPFLFVLPASAQDVVPRAEVFGGFSYLPADGNDFPRDNSYGFQTSVTLNINRWLGVVGDFGGHYADADPGPLFPNIGKRTSVYEYLVGPRFTARSPRLNFFVHALAGGATGYGGFTDETELALGGGGGLDVHLGSRFAVRVIQFDYIGSFLEILEDNVRFGAGVVIKLGN